MIRLLFLWVGLMLLASQATAQWLEAPGKGWLQVSLYHHDTDLRFDPLGNVEPLFNEEGRSITSSLFLTGVVGVVPGVDVWGQLPLHRLAFNDIAADRVSLGFGDPKLHVRVSPQLFGVQAPIPVAIRAGVKLPAGSFPIDSEIVPLTEGQRDWELILEAGHSFYPSPYYLMAWGGYRWREINDKIEREPGDEWFGLAAVGGAYDQFTWKLAVEFIYGEQWISYTAVRIPLALSERELVQLLPSVGWKIGQGVVELGARLPVSGRNLPAGPALFLGYFVRWPAGS